MFNVMYLLAARNLLDRRKNQLDAGRSNFQRDKEEFFYWILSLLEKVMNRALLVTDDFEVNIIEKSMPVVPVIVGDLSEMLPMDLVFLTEEFLGETNGYLSHLPRNDFISVMMETVEVFNEIGKVTDGSFRAQMSENSDGLLTMRVSVCVDEISDSDLPF